MRGEGKKLSEAARLLASGQLRIITGEEEDEPEEQVKTAAAAFGLRIVGSLSLEDTFNLWPENVRAFEVWRRLQTQWRVGMAGATGLAYEGVQAYFSMMGMKQKEQRELLPLIQSMESAALRAWAKK